MAMFSRGKRGLAGGLIIDEFSNLPAIMLVRVPVDGKFVYYVWNSITDDVHGFITLGEIFALKIKYGDRVTIDDFVFSGSNIQNFIRRKIRIEFSGKIDEKYLVEEMLE